MNTAFEDRRPKSRESRPKRRLFTHSKMHAHSAGKAPVRTPENHPFLVGIGVGTKLRDA